MLRSVHYFADQVRFCTNVVLITDLGMLGSSLNAIAQRLFALVISASGGARRALLGTF